MNNDIPGCFDIHMFHPQLNIFLFHLAQSQHKYPDNKQTAILHEVDNPLPHLHN